MSSRPFEGDIFYKCLKMAKIEDANAYNILVAL